MVSRLNLRVVKCSMKTIFRGQIKNTSTLREYYNDSKQQRIIIPINETNYQIDIKKFGTIFDVECTLYVILYGIH